MEKKKINLKDIVKSKYGQIANQSKPQNQSSCCGATGCCGDVDYAIFSEKYDALQGYNPDADMGLGCGLPTEYAEIKKGDSVLDLGSGAGNDCFVARSLVGKTGKVTGLDFTDEMLEKAVTNNKKMGFTNVYFVKGDIEDMPFASEYFDVIISNCVLNLVPDKEKAFGEMFRILKIGGHFCISDVVLKGKLPIRLKNDVEMYAGCVAGAIQMEKYLDIVKKKGFRQITINKERRIDIPKEILQNYLSEHEMENFYKGKIGIFSITVSAKKV